MNEVRFTRARNLIHQTHQAAGEVRPLNLPAKRFSKFLFPSEVNVAEIYFSKRKRRFPFITSMLIYLLSFQHFLLTHKDDIEALHPACLLLLLLMVAQLSIIQFHPSRAIANQLNYANFFSLLSDATLELKSDDTAGKFPDSCCVYVCVCV